MNIPIYRAKKIDSNNYVEGFYDPQKEWKTKCLKCGSLNTDSYHQDYSEYSECFSCGNKSYFDADEWEHGYMGKVEHLIRDNGKSSQVDPTTLAIHMEGMLDNKENKIFASLSKDGKGGDILILDGSKTYISFYSKEDGGFLFASKETCSGGFMGDEYCRNFKITGIQK